MCGRLVRAAVVTVVTILLPVAAFAAQSTSKSSEAPYPNKPIRLIVPFAPGGTNDILGRLVATHLTQALGQTMIVDNRPGAEGLIGTDIAAKARPDGYTLIVLSAGYVMNAAVKKLPFDPVKSFDWISKMGQSFLILTVGPSLQVSSVNDLVAAAKAKPGQIVIASSGGFMHFASALFTSLSKQNFNIVLYKGGAPAMFDVMGGQAHATMAVSAPALPHLRSGKLKGLAVGTLNRIEMLPDLPTLDEAGIKGYDASNWYSIALAAGAPKPVVGKLRDEIVRFFNLPETQKQLTSMGVIIDLRSPEEMRKIVPAEIAKWRQVAIAAGMPRE
ncbi:MAG TPA: tripartite tricarboxylate transporter substrate-binding protein [Burkholderiales bacterium]|nr:tripartite tricarboxylate transporter substrate-binding protein [Burkholderiales bacterium]